jgi:putative copper export protein
VDEGFGISPEMLAKAAGYGALIAAAGACTVRWLIAPRLLRIEGPAESQALIGSAASVLFAASTVAFAAVLFRAWTHTLAAFGFEESLVWENIRTIAIDSRWGQGWFWQVVAAAATFVISIVVNAGSTGAWPVATFSVAAFIAAVPLVGHAAGDGFRVVLHSIHLAAAGLWIGALFVLFVDLIRRRRGTAPFQLFAPVAFTGSAALALSGLIAAALYIPSPGALFGTAYGRMLLVKAGLFAAAAAYGYTNWRRMQRVSAGDRTAGASVARTVTRELALAAAVVLVTGIFTELPNP